MTAGRVRIRIVTWNMNHSFRRHQTAKQWAYLDSLKPTVALVQEAPRRDGYENMVLREIPRSGLVAGILGYEGVTLTEIPVVPLGQHVPEGHLESSHSGAFVVARAHVAGRAAITAISIYGVMTSVFTKIVYATTAVQRMLSDLTPVIDMHRSRDAVVMGGDLNITPQIPPPDSKAHVAIIDRIKAFDMIDCLGAFNDGFVRTLRHRNSPESAPYQNDWIFASKKLKAISCEALDSEDSWVLSDHCPVVAEFELEG